MDSEGWVEVVDWDRFQHYRNRRPSWVKNYVALLDDVDYLALTPTQRATLHGLWLLYAKTARKVPENTAWISRKLGVRVTKRTLAALSHAGFIRITASRPLAEWSQNARAETDKELDKGSTRSALRSELSISNDVKNGYSVTRLMDEIRDADERTRATVSAYASTLPEASISAALESLRARRRRPGPPLASEARYVVATLRTMREERQS